MKCHACGQDNADSALFCSACRRPLVAPTKLPTRLEALATPVVATAAAAAAPLGGTVGDGGGFSRDRFAPPNATGYGQAGTDAGFITDEEAWAAIVGNSNAFYYLTRFGRLSRGEGAPWHWPAMFVTWYWMLYRKMWLAALLWFFAPSIISNILVALMPSALVPISIAWFIAWLVVPAVMANGWYYRHCLKKIRDVRARGGSKEQMLARMEAVGGTSNIIVIIAAVIGIIAVIGILAAIALPAYQTYTVKAKVSEAVLVGKDVADAVGRQYEQTGTLPGDVERLVSQAPHHSHYVSGVEIDGSTGVLTIKVEAGPRITGSIQMVPSADSNRRLTWACTTEDLKRYVPLACRPDGASR